MKQNSFELQSTQQILLHYTYICGEMFQPLNVSLSTKSTHTWE